MSEFIVAALKSTALSHWMVESAWLWPVCETLHFIGLALLVGVIGLLDLRLLGFMPRISIASLRALMPWGILGFVVNLITGVMFFVGSPDQYIGNVAFWFKILFLAVAGLNALYFETAHGAEALAMKEGVTVPVSFRVAGAVSLFSWFMVLYWGRMLPFIGEAF